MQSGRPVAFESKKLSLAELNYTTGEQELLADVHAMRTWCYHWEGVEFTMITDHNPLVHLQTQPKASNQVVLQAFRWQHRPGRINVADPLSRGQNVKLAVITRSCRA